MLDHVISPDLTPYWTKRREVVGAFWDIDFALFDALLQHQTDSSSLGDLLEIGALYGKSAIVLGRHARPAETVHICDVFESQDVDRENEAENASSYPDLSRAAFEANYQTFVPRRPHIIEALSSELGKHVEPDSLRFMHVDGSHLYDVVVDDVETARTLAKPDSVVVFDDFRAIHTPGVAAAVWAAVGRGELFPVALTEQKFYGVWNVSSAEEYFATVGTWADRVGTDLTRGIQWIGGRPFHIFANPPNPSFRGRVARLLPPAVVERLRPVEPPHLGT